MIRLLKIKKPPPLSRGGLGGSGWLGFGLSREEVAHDIEGCGGGHAALFPTLNGALADAACVGELLDAEA